MKYNRPIKIWLVTGCVLLFFQIFIGGITRITGSGLSITKWEIVTGTIPPLSETQWLKEFELYKATPQYQKINQGMSLSKFKFIYFWEFFHRLWAKAMALIFIFPLLFFVYKKWVDRFLLIKLGYVFLCAMLAAVFGWIMVASGLVNRPWVNAYKLAIHLGIALLTLSVLTWTCFGVFDNRDGEINNAFFRKHFKYFLMFLILQIFFGAIVSGMRASLYYPSWPDINGEYFPSILLDWDSWTLMNFVEYDKSTFMPALIHVLHRNWGYFVYAYGMYLGIKLLRFPFKKRVYKKGIALIFLLNLQVLLGILVLINSIGTIPIFFGVMHQAIAIFILMVVLYFNYFFRHKSFKN